MPGLSHHRRTLLLEKQLKQLTLPHILNTVIPGLCYKGDNLKETKWHLPESECLNISLLNFYFRIGYFVEQLSYVVGLGLQVLGGRSQSKVPFSSPHIKGTYSQHDLTLMMLALTIWSRWLLLGFSIVQLLSFPLYFERNCSAHMCGVGSYVLLP